MTLAERLRPENWRKPEFLLMAMAAAMPLSFHLWQTLLNNFAIDRAAFTGQEIGILQSLREIPGFLSFAAVFVLLLMREQTFALLSLVLLGLGVAITGYFPSVIGLYVTTVVMSIGFHYFETMQQALTLQWSKPGQAPLLMGRLLSVAAAASAASFVAVKLLADYAGWSYQALYLLGGGATLALAAFAWFAFPRFSDGHVQNKKLVLRRRYWLYYALVFMSGARRQIFVVFAGFLMVEKFGYGVGAVALLFLVNQVINMLFAPAIGRLIVRVGERRALIFEYIGLIGVFASYAFVTDATVAAALYVVDHLFFAMAMAMKSYFQRIADPADISATASVSFTISHIVAVFIPVLFGALWLIQPGAVFLAGAAMAAVSLLLAFNVPLAPAPGNEVVYGRRLTGPAPAAAPAE